MDLDVKQKVLIMIYTEYQKDIPNMENLQRMDLSKESEVFNNAISKLQNEGYISGARIQKTYGNEDGDKVLLADLRKALITSKGIEYVESKLQIDPTDSNKQKFKKIKSKVLVVGWDKGTDFLIKVIAEMIGKQIGI